MNGPKLTIDDQIIDMKNKGITFINVDEATAKKFLKNNNYYFKYRK